MHGHMMYDIAKQRIADQRRAAEQASKARALRAAGRERRAQAASLAAAKEAAVPEIPDFAHEMVTIDEERGRPARSGR